MDLYMHVYIPSYYVKTRQYYLNLTWTSGDVVVADADCTECMVFYAYWQSSVNIGISMKQIVLHCCHQLA